jgi:hypothetical protein
VLIEPTPALPPSRAGRSRLLTAILVPAVLLVGVVGVGALTDGDDAAAESPSGSPAPLAEATPATQPTGASAPIDPAVEAARFPSRVLGLSTRSVSELVGRRRGGSVDDALHAARGYLTVRPGTEDCFIGDSTGSTLPMIQAVGCRREVILSLTDEPLLAWAGGGVVWLDEDGPEHLHIPVFQGVSLGSLETLVTDRPPVVVGGGEDAAEVTPILPRPVVILGRYDDPRVADPRTNAEHVNETFTLERVAWASDAIEEPPPIQLVAPPDGALAIEAVRARVSEALPSGTVVLSHAYLPLGQLARVDPTAAGGARSGLEALDAAAGDDAAVWYVRVMVRDGNPVDTLAGDTIPRRLGWVVLTADGTVLDLAVDGFSPDD